MVWPPKLPRDFPLTVTPKGYMARIAKKPRWICGKVPPAEALAVYHRKAAAIEAGVRPLPEPERTDPGSATLFDVLNRWVIDRRADAERGQLTAGTFGQYRASAQRINALAGHVRTDDVRPPLVREIYDRLIAAHGVDFAKRAISHLRSACTYAADMDWCNPVRLGGRRAAKLTSRPPAKMKWKLYAPAQLRTILAASLRDVRAADGRGRPAALQLHAMILLALNGGYGATELSALTRDVVDLNRGVIDYARGKTGKDHVVPLWPETVEALRPVLELRPDDDLVFRTREGNPWCRQEKVYRRGKLVAGQWQDNVNWRFSKLVKPIGLKIKGQGFYKLKHAANTAADEAGDPHATFVLFGHGLPGAKGHYVKVSEDRLRRVVEHMRRHLILSRRPARSPAPASPRRRPAA